MYKHTATHPHSINQIRGSSRESGCLMASGLIWDADVVLLLPLMRSGGVQSNIGRQGCDTAPPSLRPRRLQANSMDQSRLWSDQDGMLMLTLHIGDQSVFYPNELKSSGLELITHAEKSSQSRKETSNYFSFPTFFFLVIELKKSRLKFFFQTTCSVFKAATMRAARDVFVCCLDCLTGIRLNIFFQCSGGQSRDLWGLWRWQWV